MVRLTIAFLAAVVISTLAFADDAQAFHGGSAGCGTSASACAGAAAECGQPVRRLLGFERRQSRRAARQARRAACYGCAGYVEVSCGGAPASCAGEHEAPAVDDKPVTLGHWELRRVCNGVTCEFVRVPAVLP